MDSDKPTLLPKARLAITVGEAAESIGVSTDTIYKLLKEGTIKYKQIGKRKLVIYSSLKEFIESDI